MYIPDGECDFSPEFLLIKLHFHNFKWETLVEESVNFSTTTELHSVDLCRAWAFYGSLEIWLKLLYHP